MQSKAIWPPTVERVVICIGAEKAATSFLHRCAEETDNICTSSVKEVHFFDKAYVYPNRRYVDRARRQFFYEVKKGAVSALKFQGLNAAKIKSSYYLNALRSGDKLNLSAYQKYMCSNYGSEAVIFEATPMYCILDEEHYKIIGNVHPNTRILLSLRDPVNRAWSSVKYSLRHKVKSGEASREDVLAAFEALVSDRSRHVYRQSDYLETFEKLDRVGLWDQTHVCFMENFSTEAEKAELNACFGTNFNIHVDERVNVHNQHVEAEESILNQTVATFAPVYDAVRARFGDRVPSEWRG